MVPDPASIDSPGKEFSPRRVPRSRRLALQLSFSDFFGALHAKRYPEDSGKHFAFFASLAVNKTCSSSAIDIGKEE
jgi:hypothetical protein